MTARLTHLATFLLLLLSFLSSAQTKEIETVKLSIKAHEQEILVLKTKLAALENSYATAELKREVDKSGGLLQVAVNGSAQLKATPSLLSDNILAVPATDSLLLVKKYPDNFWLVKYKEKPYYVHEHWILQSSKFNLIKSRTTVTPLPKPASTVKSSYQSKSTETSTSSSICGAPTKTGRPCQRLVKGGGRCYQHS